MGPRPKHSFARRHSQGFKSQGSTRRIITLDGYVASCRAVEMKAGGQISEGTKVRSSKYLNNLIEQDHRGAKSRLAPMLGFRGSEPRRSPSPASNCPLLRCQHCRSDSGRTSIFEAQLAEVAAMACD
jgi:hypothetical protein